MKYTNDKEQIVFIKDGDIVSSLDGKTLSGNSVLLNGVPSFDLLSTLHSQLTAYDDKLSAYIRDIVGLSARNLSDEISSVVAVVDEDNVKYTHLSVFNLTNEAYKQLSVNNQLEKNAIYVIKDTFVSMREQQVRDVAEPTLSTDAVTKNYVDIHDGQIIAYADTISTNVEELSGTVGNLINRDKKDITYLGNVTLSDSYDDPETEGQPINTLYGLLLTNRNDRNLVLHDGFMFKAVSDEHLKEYTVTDGTASILLRDNDYIIIVNDNIAISAVSINDITLIKDYDLSVKYLQDQILSNDVDISCLSGHIDWLSSDLSSAKDVLSSNIQTIYATIKGGVNYKGHIDLDKTIDDDPTQPVYPAGLSLSSIFTRYYPQTIVNGVYTNNIELSNGYLYNITTKHEYITQDQISFENNDYVIIHNHNGNGIDISALTRDNIDIIESLQDDYVRLNQLEKLSSDLSGEIVDLSTALSADINSLSDRLSGDIDSLSSRLSADIDSLSTRLSNEIDDLSVNLSGDISSLSVRLSNDIYDLSTKVSAEISSLQIEDIWLSSEISSNVTIIDSESHRYNKLSVLELTNAQYNTLQQHGQLANNTIYIIKDTYTDARGQQFKNLAGPIDLSDATTKEYVDGNIQALSDSISATVNDEFVSLTGDVGIGPLGIDTELSVGKRLTLADDNKKFVLRYSVDDGKIYTHVKDIDQNRPISDISEHEYQFHEFQQKSGIIAHTSDIGDLSTALSGDIDSLSVRLSGDVDSLSARLSSEIETLSISLSNTVSVSIDLLQNQVISNDNDITYLSAQLSTVADDHYYRTLSAIESKGHTDAYPDNLLLTDHSIETNHKNYFMLFKYGTLVLSSIN